MLRHFKSNEDGCRAACTELISLQATLRLLKVRGVARKAGTLCGKGSFLKTQIGEISSFRWVFHEFSQSFRPQNFKLSKMMQVKQTSQTLFVQNNSLSSFVYQDASAGKNGAMLDLHRAICVPGIKDLPNLTPSQFPLLPTGSPNQPQLNQSLYTLPPNYLSTLSLLLRVSYRMIPTKIRI